MRILWLGVCGRNLPIVAIHFIDLMRSRSWAIKWPCRLALCIVPIVATGNFLPRRHRFFDWLICKCKRGLRGGMQIPENFPVDCLPRSVASGAWRVAGGAEEGGG